MYINAFVDAAGFQSGCRRRTRMTGLFASHGLLASPVMYACIACVVHFLLCLLPSAECNITQHSAPAMFVFGDSLVDAGNNNYIPTLAKANFLPNGVDLPTHAPTGRFCNGKIISDFISDYMGVPSVLPILDPNAQGENLLRGANFASAGVGILDDTGSIFARRLIMPQQFELFEKYRKDLTALTGQEAARRLISKSLFTFTIGGNDYINNYLLPLAQRARQLTPLKYRKLLISTFELHLKKMYDLGARKITVSSMGPLGCIPSQLAMSSQTGSCIPILQQYSVDFNSDLKLMLNDLNRILPGAIILYVNAYDMMMDYINNPSLHGFESANRACCGQGSYNGVLICTAVSSLCTNRNSYIFWDPFHPTEIVNALISKRIWSGPASDISPMNLSKLSALGF